MMPDFIYIAICVAFAVLALAMRGGKAQREEAADSDAYEDADVTSEEEVWC